MWGRVAVFKNKHWLNRQQQQQQQQPQRKGQNQLDGILAGHLGWQGRPTKAKTADHWPGRGIPDPGQHTHTHLEPSNTSRA
ncbi:hypothetical protein GE21DRAFT_1309330 [Neurospora crassa]|nr:hypothetical protein GE21DRAFT_1309330 [Neurospora crassa]